MAHCTTARRSQSLTWIKIATQAGGATAKRRGRHTITGMDSLVISATATPPWNSRAVEMCEHKGIGHPDSICDGIAEAASQALCRAYLAQYGAIQHHNVDKALLVGGEATPRFGGGELLAPARLILCGRASALPPPLHLDEVLEQAVRDYLAQHLRHARELFRIEIAVRAGSPNLRQVFARGAAIANDTSFGVGYAPLSPLEQAVLALADAMRMPDFQRAFPAAGDDFKIMGRRVGSQLAMTVALAFIDRQVASSDAYQQQKEAVRAHLQAQLGSDCPLTLNALDRSQVVTEADCFLTVTGLSAEQGDDGEVGRGNRVNRLITPNRTMSLEAAAGKNPVAHAGKLYNVLARQMAAALQARLDGAEVTVQLLSEIGAPLDQPRLVHVDVRQAAPLSPAEHAMVREVVAAQLRALPALSQDIVAGKVRLF